MLDTDEIISHIHRLRKIGQDTQMCEVKEAAGKLPSSVPETMSAFANGEGGLFLLGLSEKERFAPVDGFNAASMSKLAASRTVSLTGAVTGSGSFDGSADLSIDAELSDLDAAKITSGTLATARGGTGRTDGKAVALATARTISLTGDVTGSVSFDGSKNVSISVKKKNAAAQFSAAGTRSGNIAASTNYTVPSYVAGSGHLKVYLDGVLCTGGTDADTCTYKEVGTSGSASTLIRFYQDIPATMDVLVTV